MAFDRFGQDAKDALLGLLPEGWVFSGKQVLDFGCGAGRTLRHFLREAEDGSLWGVDIDAPSIAWLRETLSPPLNVLQGPEAPPLSLQSASFDLVWALSVFTHLTDASLAWLAELHRLLKPDGLLIATYMGRFNSERYLGETWSDDLIGMNVLRPDQGWDEGGPLVMMSDWWVRAHWGRAFEFVDVTPEVQGQTWVLLRKRDIEITVDELERPEDDPREIKALRHNVKQAVREAEQRHRDATHIAVQETQAEFENSMSWRLTRPLRRAAGRIRARG